MDIISLPAYLGLDETAPVQLFDYQTADEHLKTRINLKANVFSFLQEGTKEVLTNHDPIHINDSAFLIIKSGHCLMTEKLSMANQHYRSVLLFFSDDILASFIRKHGLNSTKASASKSVEVGIYDQYINSFVQGLLDLKLLSPLLQQKLLRVKLEEILLYLVETRGEEVIRFLLSNTDDYTQNLIKVVENNKLNRLTVKELAFLSNTSVSTFKREFERHFHTSPMKWFRDKRLEHSAFLLRQSRRPSDIFHEVGYENVSNFTQAFKTKFGLTPKQYQIQS
ncbi:MAG: helix-turn-helix transcriptional regulator [Bacteroidia bacterium]